MSQARWDEAAADFARELELLPEGRSTWFTPRNMRALELARWDQMYARLLELRPDDGQLWSVRGRYHARRSHWDQAAADFARGVPSAPPESEEWFEHACLRLIVGDHEGYRASVREIRRRAGRIEDPFLAFVLARTAGMTADETVVEPAQAIRWAEQAVASNLNGWYLQALGIAYYRAGQLDQAIQRLEESNAGNWADEGKMQNRLVLAMAHHRLGYAAPARALLEEVEGWWKAVEAGKIDGAVAFSTTDWLPLQLLRREAEALIRYDAVFPDDPFAR
jgi:tetratricopeptide (TPR) repeat protein